MLVERISGSYISDITIEERIFHRKYLVIWILEKPNSKYKKFSNIGTRYERKNEQDLLTKSLSQN